MKNLNIGNFRLFYEDRGRGEPILLVHGMGSDHTVWEGMIPLLKKNYRVLAVDLRGHGASSKPQGPYSIKLFAQDMYQFIESLGISQVHFIGHSMGGAIGLELTLQHPEIIGSLTLISSFAYADSPLRDVLKELKKILTQEGYNAFFNACLQLANTTEFIQDNKELFQVIMNDMAKTISISAIRDTLNACGEVDFRTSLKNVKTPTMIIAGEDDIFTPPSHSIKIKNAIYNSKIEIINNGTHNMLVERPQETCDLIYPFLKEFQLAKSLK